MLILLFGIFFFLMASPEINETCPKFRIFMTYFEFLMRSCYVTEFKHEKKWK